MRILIVAFILFFACFSVQGRTSDNTDDGSPILLLQLVNEGTSDEESFRLRVKFSGGKEVKLIASPGTRKIERGIRTPKGTFHIERRYRKYTSRKFKVPMPFSIFFYKGVAIHAKEIVNGKRGSHGCIGLTHKDAKWLFELVEGHLKSHGKESVIVQILDN